MFPEWTDPFDIDNYYGDIDSLMKDIKPATQYYRQALPPATKKFDAHKIETPTAPVVVQPKDMKASFEITPNSLFMDDHPVGSQPEYNILRSGPPVKEKFSQEGCDQTILYILISIVFLLTILLIHSHSRLSDLRCMMKWMLKFSDKKKAMD